MISGQTRAMFSSNTVVRQFPNRTHTTATSSGRITVSLPKSSSFETMMAPVVAACSQMQRRTIARDRARARVPQHNPALRSNGPAQPAVDCRPEIASLRATPRDRFARRQIPGRRGCRQHVDVLANARLDHLRGEHQRSLDSHATRRAFVVRFAARPVLSLRSERFVAFCAFHLGKSGLQDPLIVEPSSVPCPLP